MPVGGSAPENSRMRDGLIRRNDYSCVWHRQFFCSLTPRSCTNTAHRFLDVGKPAGQLAVQFGSGRRIPGAGMASLTYDQRMSHGCDKFSYLLVLASDGCPF